MIILNLLTIQDKKNLTKHYLTLLSKDVIFSLLLLSAVLSIILLICQFILTQNFIQTNQNTLLTMKGNQIIIQHIRQINQDLKQVKKIQDKNIDWVQILLYLNNMIPQDEIQITNLEIDYSKNSIILQGKSLSRDAFLTLKQNLEDSEYFENIKSPLSNLLLAKNLEFELEFGLSQKNNGI